MRAEGSGQTAIHTRSCGSARLLVGLAAWTLFAFAGAPLWTALSLILGAALVAVIVRPRIATGSDRVLDFALGACLLAVALQLVPWTPRVRAALSPQVAAVDAALWLEAPQNASAGPPRPLSVDPAATRVALGLGAAYGLMLWSARAVFERGGIRVAARGVAWTGLVLSVVAMLQHATAPRLLYWRWPTVFGGPFGPYLNRNDFATWLIMAIPLTIGYILTRIESRRRNGDGGLSIERAIDATAVWLVGSVCLMSAALLVSLSRSGLTGAVVSLACLLWLSRRRLGSRGRASLLAAVTVMIAIAATYANLGALADRVGETIETGIGGRLTIWRETWSMVRDFWIAGTGVGAYERGMLVYQQTKGLFYVNHAHNEYLQLLAEGGVLVCAVAALTAAAGVAQIAGRLRRDSSPIFWVRAGAVSGLIAVAVQGIWDTGLRMPANAVLFAILAAVTLHRRE